MSEEIEVYFVHLEDLDASDLGFTNIIPILKATKKLTMRSLMGLKFDLV